MLGLAALVLAFLQIFASYAVLNTSNGRSVTDWKFKPSVYLAILTVVSNGAISFALTQGAVVSFWLRALRGTTLAELHRNWAYGSDFYSAVCAGKHFTILATACIAATLVCIDGPLLQRASFTRSISGHRPIELNIAMVPEIPAYFTGSYKYSGKWPQADFSEAMLPIVKDYASKRPINGVVRGCEGVCTATIRAPALVATHCEPTTTHKNYSAPYTTKEMEFFNNTNLVPASRIVFKSMLSSMTGPAETLDFHTYLTSDEVAQTCAGPAKSTRCFLQSAVADYEVLVTNDTVALKDAANPLWISWANNTALTEQKIAEHHLRRDQNSDWINTTLGGIVNAFISEYEFVEGSKPPDTDTPGHLTIRFQSKAWFMFQHITNYRQYNNGSACSYAWKDPRPAAMAGLNELMFRIGAFVAHEYDFNDLKPLLDPGVQIHQEVIGFYESPYEVFKSEWAFYFGAAVVELLSIFLVASTFWGFWRLGRGVSLSPLETAKALGASLLAKAPSNSCGGDIASHLEAQLVKYGDVNAKAKTDVTGRHEEILVIARQDLVEEPHGQPLTMQEERHRLRRWISSCYESWKAWLTIR